MKKFFVMAAFLVGPIIYAQQKPATASDVKKAEIIKANENKTADAVKYNSLSDAKAVDKKASATKAEAKAKRARKSDAAENLSDAAID